MGNVEPPRRRKAPDHDPLMPSKMQWQKGNDFLTARTSGLVFRKLSPRGCEGACRFWLLGGVVVIASGKWLLAGSLFVAATGTSAATIDFTDNATYSTRSSAEATGSAAGFDFTLTGSRNALTFTEADAPGPLGALLGQNDGIGIGDDEVGGSEYVTLTFDRRVRITGLYFLDLFQSRNASDSETVAVYAGTPPSGGTFLQMFTATEAYSPTGFGYGAFQVDFTGLQFSFDVGTGNDGVGVGDFALAGLDITPIPVPAGALLLGTALLGFGLSRRR